MPTYTTNYNLAKPLVNSAVDQDVWGNELNSDMDIIDSTMKSISDSIPTVATILAAVYPVGSYYINESDSTNPATLFGFGTWTAVTDKFIVGRGSTYTSTGGAATATISQANLPNINLYIQSNGGVLGDGTFATGPSLNGVADNCIGGSGPQKAWIIPLGGSGTPINTVPPYQAAYIWKRTA